MAALIPGLPDLPALRSLIIATLGELLGTYTFPAEEGETPGTGPAIAVDGLNAIEESYPPNGTQVEGLEVVITPATDLPGDSCLDGYTQYFKHTITLKQRSGFNQTLQAFQLLQGKLQNIFEGSAIRQLANPLLNNVETLTFDLEQVIFVPDELQLYEDVVLVPLPDSGVSASSYERTFTEADLTVAGLLPVNHNLNSYPSAVGIFDGNTEQVQPDKIDILTTDSLAIDLSSYRPLIGVWTVSVVI